MHIYRLFTIVETREIYILYASVNIPQYIDASLSRVWDTRCYIYRDTRVYKGDRPGEARKTLKKSTGGTYRQKIRKANKENVEQRQRGRLGKGKEGEV